MSQRFASQALCTEFYISTLMPLPAKVYTHTCTSRYILYVKNLYKYFIIFHKLYKISQIYYFRIHFYTLQLLKLELKGQNCLEKWWAFVKVKNDLGLNVRVISELHNTCAWFSACTLHSSGLTLSLIFIHWRLPEPLSLAIVDCHLLDNITYY